MALVPRVKDGDWNSVRRALQQLQSATGLGPLSSPTFVGLTLSGLTANRLLASDGSAGLVSSDLNSWISGTTNQVVVTDNGDGTVTLSLPQDVHVDATPEFAGYTIKDSSNSIVAFLDQDEFYITKHEVGTGTPIGLLLILTHEP